MKRLIVLPVAAVLCFSCGAGSSNSVSISATDVVPKIEQDVLCYTTTNSTNSTQVPTVPPAVDYTFTLKAADFNSEFGNIDETLLFQGCSVSVEPLPGTPSLAADPTVLNDIVTYTYCSSDDIPPGGSATASVTFDQYLVQEMNGLWKQLQQPLSYRLTVTYNYQGANSDLKASKSVTFAVTFDNFIFNAGDACQ
ncbi:hypothetical protein [Thermovibrio ammonificans]|uniref:Lipoprotein n=1 Tax=Thermovibrio ammonificans (strain DSM 15698 / JCM 12110 / HB-1) TaxID=648996 RepID=E8T1X6_THEA1|nr:hypothetical protein [Thermovibrio ammonificans]ADU96871.1 hypothetical protein Theam_0904 [Thermovibrio ammonificans HB-1]